MTKLRLDRIALLGFCAAVWTLIALNTIAHAQTILQAPSIRWGSQYTSPGPVSIISYDTSTGLPCIAGSTATCPLGGSGSGSNAAAGLTGSAVPTSAGYTGFNVGGNLVGVSASNPLPITGTINASSTATATAAAPSYTEAQVAPFSQNLTGDLRTISKQSGTWTSTVTQSTAASLNATVVGTGTFSVQNTAATPAGSNIIGNFRIDQTTPGTTNGVQVNSSALPTGAATSALQTTGNTSLSTIATNTTGSATSALQTTGNTALGTTASTACASSASTCDIIAALKALIAAAQSTAPVAIYQANSGTLGGVATTPSASFSFDQSTAGTYKVVSGASSKIPVIFGFALVGSAAQTVAVKSGTGTNCATGTATVVGIMSFGANGGINYTPEIIGPVGADLCFTISASVQTGGGGADAVQ